MSFEKSIIKPNTDFKFYNITQFMVKSGCRDKIDILEFKKEDFVVLEKVIKIPYTYNATLEDKENTYRFSGDSYNLYVATTPGRQHPFYLPEDALKFFTRFKETRTVDAIRALFL